MAVSHLGFKPIRANMILSEGADFVCTLYSPDEQWPAGSECWIEFPDIPAIHWEAEVSVNPDGSRASFVVQETDTQAADVPKGSKYRLYLRYATTPTTEYLWYYGPVIREE